MQQIAEVNEKPVGLTDPFPEESGQEFWERRYQQSAFSLEKPIRPPRERLKEFVEKLNLTPRVALCLGCGRGEDAIWLAQQGWLAVGADFSPTAIAQARALAAQMPEPVSRRVSFKLCNLEKEIPAGTYDLISAQFFESPIPFARNRILNRAADYVATNGVLLVTSHVSRPPWSWPMRFTPPTPEAALEALNLDLSQWEKICVADLNRIATSPKGEKAIVKDGVICLRRL